MVTVLYLVSLFISVSLSGTRMRYGKTMRHGRGGARQGLRRGWGVKGALF
jgi:hypothetical protein